MSNKCGSEWNRWDLHLHTASSYDYKYKGDDADDILCRTLRKNNIKAVAITDHFKIDNERIEQLRKKAPDIVFFPGVELRTDKGSNNLHLILIFSDKLNLQDLSNDFDSIMIRQKAKSKENEETIYWEFNDIITFANEHDALITIHAGKKSNGIDKEISNALPFKQAIKSDIAESIHFFEVGQKKDIEGYEKEVFKSIDRKPLIICSDNHDPRNYSTKEKLWIKADITFSGLKQCIYHPEERVFIGDVPPLLDRREKNKQNNIASISCSRVNSPVNNKDNWFDFNIPLNSGMVAIIGNKGSGKSAFSDIIGHLCNCSTIKAHASFLNKDRFKKMPKNYAKDYSATLTWIDGENNTKHLDEENTNDYFEYAQYLPQKYIETLCNDFEDVFQKEIDRVIFSYIDESERGDARNLKELITLKSKPLQIKLENEYHNLTQINQKIIELEIKQTKEYQKVFSAKLHEVEETLKRHDGNKPNEIKKPVNNDLDEEYQSKLKKLNDKIGFTKEQLVKQNDLLKSCNEFINDIQILMEELSQFQIKFNQINVQTNQLFEKYKLDNSKFLFNFEFSKDYLQKLIKDAENKKENIQTLIYSEENGLHKQLREINLEKDNLINSTNSQEKEYQKYLKDLSEWENKRNEIIGSDNKADSIKGLKYELNYIDNKLMEDYMTCINDRDQITQRIFEGIIELSNIYRDIYSPMQNEISKLLENLDDSIVFQVEVFMKDYNIAEKIISFINQKYNGKYGRTHDSVQEIEDVVKKSNFGELSSVMEFVHNMADVITSDLETAPKRVSKCQEFYDFIFGLKYLDVTFKLKIGERSLEELSPGERGILLLIFYLALNKDSKPIIIDQPEDNLDNQSVYSKLVPCICKAKQKRQVIIVTHNPNIAVACDAEQIIYCEKNKCSNHIEYISGSIENPEMGQHIVDVLEGTMPAFDLRKLKYNSY